MAKYKITLTEEELEEVICGLDMIIDRCCDYEEEEPTRKLIDKINKQKHSTAEVVEVVRCKDCIHKVDLNGRVMCNRNARKHQYYDEWLGLTATDNKHFCSYGERIETE